MLASSLNFIGSGSEIIRLVSSANKTILLFLFIECGKSFIYKSLWISHLPAGCGLSLSLSVCSGTVLAEEFDAVGVKGSGDTKTIYVGCLFLNMLLRSAYFIDKAIFCYCVLKITFLKC